MWEEELEQLLRGQRLLAPLPPRTGVCEARTEEGKDLHGSCEHSLVTPIASSPTLSPELAVHTTTTLVLCQSFPHGHSCAEALSSPEGTFIDPRERDREREILIDRLLYTPSSGIEPITFWRSGRGSDPSKLCRQGELRAVRCNLGSLDRAGIYVPFFLPLDISFFPSPILLPSPRNRMHPL